MKEGPTRGADVAAEGQWDASPIAAISIRVVSVALPFVTAWFVVTALAESFYRPDGSLGVVLWLLQALITGLSVSITTERFTRRALPLASLFNMTLVFPDQAPSRFSTALRANTVRKLESRTGKLPDERLGDSPAEAAAAAIQLVSLLAQHDRLTRGHTERVRAYADLIAEEMQLPAHDRQKLAWGALLHDIGKMSVPPEILNKETKPTAAEWEILQGHPAASARMLEPLQGWLGEWVLAAPQHHERWDGEGYPLGLAQTGISLAGRIVAVADAYDVMTSRRSYKAPLSSETARKELIRCSGTQFDPDVVRAFLNVSLGRRWLTGPLASLAELPRVVNLGANLPAASAIVAGTVASVGSLAIGTAPANGQEPDLAFVDTVASAQPLETVSSVAIPSSTTVTVTIPPDGEPVATIAATPVIDDVADDVEQDLVEPLASTSSSIVESSGGAEGPPDGPTTTQQPTATTAPATTSGAGVTTTTQQMTTTTQPTTTTTTTQPTTTTTQATTTTTQATTTSSTLPPGSPSLVADSVTVDDDKDVRIHVLDNDDSGNSSFDESTLEIITDPLHAKSFRVHNDHIHYRSDKDYDGIDTIEYRVCNTNGLCHTAVVTITVES